MQICFCYSVHKYTINLTVVESTNVAINLFTQRSNHKCLLYWDFHDQKKHIIKKKFHQKGQKKRRKKAAIMGSIQFKSDVGLGKIAVAAFGIGFVMAAHVCLLIWTIFTSELTNDSLRMALGQWALYMMFLCFFHFSEFISTAAFKPGFVSYECKLEETQVRACHTNFLIFCFCVDSVFIES